MTAPAKRVLITGGGRGIGAAITRAFLDKGARVVIGHSTQENAERAVSELSAEGLDPGTLHAVGADLSSASGCRELADRALNLLGGIDILVNNAGIVGKAARAAFEETDDELLDKVIDVNLKAPFRLSRNLSTSFEKGGVIVNIGSAAGFRALNGVSAYCISKSGLEMLTKTMALELASRQIRVVGIAPGDIESQSGPTEPPAQATEPGKSPHPSMLNRSGQAREVAAVVVFVSSDAASYVTGTTIVVDGGMLATLS